MPSCQVVPEPVRRSLLTCEVCRSGEELLSKVKHMTALRADLFTVQDRQLNDSPCQ